MHLHLEAQMLCVERDSLLNIAHDVANIHRRHSCCFLKDHAALAFFCLLLSRSARLFFANCAAIPPPCSGDLANPDCQYAKQQVHHLDHPVERADQQR